ncbi:MAG: hypothetical protein KTR30_17965 [Saprospiraceae bacterium]|nr:hypothetical protein [Saprospiraceae bacterium]
MLNRLSSVLITLLLFWGSSAAGQMKNEQAATNLEQLRQNVLVVRLPSQSKKINALADLAEKTEVSTQERARAKLQWETTKAEARAEAMIIQASFSNYFDYAPVLFMYDYASPKLTKGERTGFFLDKNLEASDAVLDQEPFYILDIGYTDPSNSARSFAFIIKDQSYQSLSAPFPYAQRINTPALAFDQLLGRNSMEKYYRKAVIRLNKRLYRAAGRVPTP